MLSSYLPPSDKSTVGIILSQYSAYFQNFVEFMSLKQVSDDSENNNLNVHNAPLRGAQMNVAVPNELLPNKPKTNVEKSV